MKPLWFALALAPTDVDDTRRRSDDRPVAVGALTLSEVVSVLDTTHPKLAQFRLKQDEQEGKALAARGGFDPMLRASTKWTPIGYYETGIVDVQMTQSTPLWGLQASAGYRIGWGNFPNYKGDLQTTRSGELRGGLSLPLWRGGPTDPTRTKMAQTTAFARAAGFDVAAERLRIQQAAAQAYWDWVQAGLEQRVVRDLLRIAQERAQALAEQVAAGSVAEIALVDNARLVLEREDKAVQAEQKFAQASVKLSLYLRTTSNEPIVVGEERLPPGMPTLGHGDDVDVDAAILSAQTQRPEFAALDEQLRASRANLRLAKNRLAPQVDAQAFASRDLGTGSARLEPTEFGVGLALDMPLAFRQARGERRAAQANLRRIEEQRRALRDEVGADVRQAAIGIEATRRRVVLARQQAEAAERLAHAERERLLQGASDLLSVNLRELSAASARALEIEAMAQHQLAWARWTTAQGVSL